MKRRLYNDQISKTDLQLLSGRFTLLSKLTEEICTAKTNIFTHQLIVKAFTDSQNPQYLQ